MQNRPVATRAGQHAGFDANLLAVVKVTGRPVKFADHLIKDHSYGVIRGNRRVTCDFRRTKGIRVVIQLIQLISTVNIYMTNLRAGKGSDSKFLAFAFSHRHCSKGANVSQAGSCALALYDGVSSHLFFLA